MLVKIDDGNGLSSPSQITIKNFTRLLQVTLAEEKFVVKVEASVVSSTPFVCDRFSTMLNTGRPHPDEVEELLLNARLRDELEPFLDESVGALRMQDLPTKVENDYLASMLAWERAPVLPISQWFGASLDMEPPDALDDKALRAVLRRTIHQLYDARIVLEFTEHLSDRRLYQVIFRDILPSPEKKIDSPSNYLRWHCLDIDTEMETWLRYYATPQEREEWSLETEMAPPPAETPPYPRKMPCRPSL